VDGRVEIRRLLLGTVMIALAANVKITAVVALACVGVAMARRMGGGIRHLMVAAIGMVVVFVVVTTAVSAGSGLGFSWIPALDVPSRVDSWMAPTNEIGFLIGGIGSLLGAHITQSAIRVAELLGAVVAVVLGVRLIWAAFRARVHPLRALGLLLALVLVCGPAVQPWYLLWAVVPLAAVVHLGRSRTMLVAVVAVVAVILPPTGGSFAGHVTGLVEAYAAAVLVLGTGLVVARGKLSDPAGHTAHHTPSPTGRREPR
ncbi:MAG: polyprenol phosphomannose-dependent alpha 1,6 mannosyltransferase MptB, partial [Sciscionella sp.]